MSKPISSILPSAPEPRGPLNRYRMLSPTASVRVSPLCLGAMNFGSAWAPFMGDISVAEVEGILDYFYSQGGNFIDTANNYQDNQSEQWIGEWMKKRGVRDEMVIATKYSTNYQAGHGDKKLLVNYNGNGSKSLHVSVNASLKKLQTDYIDLLYVHWYDYSTGVEEMMQSLNHLVTAGKVLYLGISDTPAWVVSKANEYARNHGLRQFSVYQGRWSAASRDFERDIIPMCRAEGMGLCPWGALGGGKFKTDEQWKAAEKEGGRGVQASEADKNISKVLDEIAKAKNTLITSVAQAYVTHKTPYVFPIVGGRKIDHLKGNIEAIDLQLTEDEINKIEDAVPFDLGFPHNFLWPTGNKLPKHYGQIGLLSMGGTTDYVEAPRPIALSRLPAQK